MVKLPGRDGEAEVRLDEWQGPAWPVWQCRILAPTADTGVVRPLGGGLNDDLGTWAWTEGIFDPSGPATSYRPSEEGVALLRGALAIDVQDQVQLLGFVNRWGTLGVGVGTLADTAALLRRPNAVADSDSVWATRRALLAVQASFRWLLALREQRWRSSDIPGLEYEGGGLTGGRRSLLTEARKVAAPPDHARLELDLTDAEYERLDTAHAVDLAAMAGHEDPYFSSSLQGMMLAARARRLGNSAELHWRAFAAALRPHLRTVHPTIAWQQKDKLPMPAWRVRRPVDVLWVTLWDWATRGGHLRRCRNCQDWFPVDRRGKIYCSPECANRGSSRAWYEAKGRRLRKAARRRRRTR